MTDSKPIPTPAERVEQWREPCCDKYCWADGVRWQCANELEASLKAHPGVDLGPIESLLKEHFDYLRRRDLDSFADQYEGRLRAAIEAARGVG